MKTLFTFNIQSFSDVITNSSSELFVFNNNKSTESVVELLDSVYPNWRSEYATPMYLKDCERPDQEQYADELYGIRIQDYDWKEKRWLNDDEKKQIAKDRTGEIAQKFGLTSEEGYICYFNDWYTPTDALIDKIIDVDKDVICLWSLDENPNWDYQEKLMEVAKRYHLG